MWAWVVGGFVSPLLCCCCCCRTSRQLSCLWQLAGGRTGSLALTGQLSLTHSHHQGRGQLTQVPQLTREGASLPALTPFELFSCPLPSGPAPLSYPGQVRVALPCAAAHEGRSQLSHTTRVRGGTSSPAPSGPALPCRPGRSLGQLSRDIIMASGGSAGYSPSGCSSPPSKLQF